MRREWFSLVRICTFSPMGAVIYESEDAAWGFFWHGVCASFRPWLPLGRAHSHWPVSQLHFEHRLLPHSREAIHIYVLEQLNESEDRNEKWPEKIDTMTSHNHKEHPKLKTYQTHVLINNKENNESDVWWLSCVFHAFECLLFFSSMWVVTWSLRKLVYDKWPTWLLLLGLLLREVVLFIGLEHSLYFQRWPTFKSRGKISARYTASQVKLACE